MPARKVMENDAHWCNANKQDLLNILRGYRLRRAWCRGQLALQVEAMTTSFRRPAYLIMPYIDWMAQDRQGPSYETDPWPKEIEIAPELTQYKYEDRLIRGFQWRMAHYQRVQRGDRPVNRPIFIQDWPGKNPPTRMYMRRLCLIDPNQEREEKDIEDIIDRYNSMFCKIQAIYQYHRSLGDHMQAITRLVASGGDTTHALELATGLQVPAL